MGSRCDATDRVHAVTHDPSQSGPLPRTGKTAVIVPVLARDEEHQTTTQESMFNFVRFSSGGQAAMSPELRSEVDIVAGLAERILPPDRFDWSALRSHDELRKAIADTVSGYERAAAEPEASPKRRRRKSRGAGVDREFLVGGRVLHEPKFHTPDGRAFHSDGTPR